MWNHLHSSLHSNTLTDVRVADRIDASEKLSQRSTLIRYNETKPQVHLSDEMTHRFTFWWILSAEIDFIHKSMVCEGTLHSCVCAYRRFYTRHNWPDHTSRVFDHLFQNHLDKKCTQLNQRRKFWSVERYTRLIFNLHLVQWLNQSISINLCLYSVCYDQNCS